jgi:hypothetical protein
MRGRSGRGPPRHASRCRRATLPTENLRAQIFCWFPAPNVHFATRETQLGRRQPWNFFVQRRLPLSRTTPARPAVPAVKNSRNAGVESARGTIKAASVGAPRAGAVSLPRAENLMLERDALGIVLLEPFVRGGSICEHLDVLGTPDHHAPHG